MLNYCHIWPFKSMVYLNFGTVNNQLDDIALSRTSEGLMQESLVSLWKAELSPQQL